MQPYPYGPYQYPNGAAMPVRYMVPTGYRQSSPPFANQSFDRFAGMQPAARPPQNMTQPIYYQPVYRPGYMPPNMQMPVGSVPRPQQQQQQQQQPQAQHKQSEQLQPPQPYYYNPYGANPAAAPAPTTPATKKGAKEFKENAFTIAPDGTQTEAIKGLVSNHDINDLLKHKGTKVKVSKIYRISKTKPDIKQDDSSDEDLPPLPPPPPPPIQQPRSQSNQQRPSQSNQQPRSQPIQRPISSSSSDSHCSTCSNCSCSDCRDRKRSHVYDDCPECRAELEREQSRRQRRK